MGRVAAAVAKKMSEAEMLEWLRKHVDPQLPDIFNMEEFEPNGCGPDIMPFLRPWMPEKAARTIARLMEWIIPDKIPGLPEFKIAGHYHDWKYFKGGTWRDRLKADRALRAIMRKLTPIRGNWRAVWAWARMRFWSEVYYRFVRAFGWVNFNFHEQDR
jgi:hypothetical protein